MGDGIGDFAFWLAIGLTGLGLTLGPIGTAIARWIESKSRPGLPEGTEARLAEMEDGLARRLLELEERVDFAERMLVEPRHRGLRDADTPPAPADAARG